MRKLKLISSLIFLGTVVPCLSSCGDKELDIVFHDFIDPAYIGDEYDMLDAIIVEKGVNYSLECYYFNEEIGAEFKVDTNGTKFTPTIKYDISAVITATKKEESITKTKLIKVKQHSDPIDELLASDGICSWADPEIYKELNDDPLYIHGENSRSSLYCTFNGSKQYVYGCGVFSLQNFRFFDYYTDTTWEDAILRMWVYNLNDSDMEWQLRLVDNYIASHFVDIDWGQQMSISQIAKAHEWTEILFPLRKMGITHTLLENEEQTRKDQFNVKCRLVDAPSGEMENYSFRFAVDQIDVVPHGPDYYPEMDTTNRNTRETSDMGWENLVHDNGWETSSTYFDNEFVYGKDRESLSSLVLEFKDKFVKDRGYNVIFDCEVAAGATGQIPFLPDLRNGSIKADFFFDESITNRKVKILSVLNNCDWAVVTESRELELTSIEDGWYRLNVDLSTLEEFSNMDESIRLGFIFPGVTESNKATAKVHLDNFFYSKL